MSSKIDRPFSTAAWRISLWSGVAFAVGTAIAFWFLQSFLAAEIQNRADAWLTGELGVLADVTQKSPDDVVSEVSELASREVPHINSEPSGPMNRAVFFMQARQDGTLALHTGAGSGALNLSAIQNSGLKLREPHNVFLPRFAVPFRVASMELQNGDRIYLGLSTDYERMVLKRLRLEFTALWCAIIALGTLIVFVSTRRTLGRVRLISETAVSIGRSNLSSRVPDAGRNDEIAHLSSTFNQMLDRIEATLQQLHTMSDSLAHDLRSPMTSLRGKLELALMSEQPAAREDAIISSIDQVDRMTALLNTSLDVSEASVDALRLKRERIDLRETVRSIVELYEPAFAQADLTIEFHAETAALVEGDPALLQRTVTNLLDNEIKHVRSGSRVTVTVRNCENTSQLSIEDDGAGFPDNVVSNVFEKYVKGAASDGHGLGLAFVAAVVRSHDGKVLASNRPDGGALIEISLPT